MSDHSLSERVRAAFQADGSLASRIEGYRARPQQVDMALAIADAVDVHAQLVAEAGTGTGKTFAYLVPALLSGGKVIVSTGTKTLQDQLFAKDIPMVREALSMPVQIALLKGRANYVCHYHLAQALAEGRFVSREDAGYVRTIARFATITRNGDKAECYDVPEDATIWFNVTSTRENCLGQDCPQHKECFVMAARRKAQEADLVVVNHHLFFADVMLRDEGMAELLPACNTVIFDEAHQLPETARLFFGQSVSTGQVIDLVRDARNEGVVHAKDCLDLQAACRDADKAARDLRLCLGLENARFARPALVGKPGFDDALNDLDAALERLEWILKDQAGRAEGLEHCWQRATQLRYRLAHWRDDRSAAPATAPDEGAEPVGGAEWVRWAETFSHSLQLSATPIDVAAIFRKQLDSGPPRAWIFTSATLAVQKDFRHFNEELGLSEARTGCWDSPFDYPKQAILYAPDRMPDPNAPGYTEAVVDAAWPVIRASGGRAFVLCTSLRAMRRAHELLAERMDRERLDFPLLLQGEGSKGLLLEQFRRLGNAILVGSQSFWEGVDVRGEALSLVIIDKLPFSPPDDPVLAARIDLLKKQGRNAFMEVQLPRAVISVKQGAGRLIRDEADRGVLMICDPRLLTKQYGKRIWRSLPPMARTRRQQDVVDFFDVARNTP